MPKSAKKSPSERSKERYKQAIEVLNYWVGFFNLGDWNIRINIVDKIPSHSLADQPDGLVENGLPYKNATITLKKSLFEGHLSDTYLNKVISHELLHILFAQGFEDSLRRKLGDGDISKELDEKLETLIDSLSHAVLKAKLGPSWGVGRGYGEEE